MGVEISLLINQTKRDQISAGTYVVERSWGGHPWGSTARKSVMDIRGGNVVCGGVDKSIDIPVVARPKLVRERRL